jgi:hypothetical protein
MRYSTPELLRQTIAYHEAGHAVVARSLGLDVDDVDISHDAGTTIIGLKVYAIDESIMAILAGRVAEWRYRGEVDHATDCRRGTDDEHAETLADEWRLDKTEPRDVYLTRMRIATEALVSRPAQWAAIVSVARLLMEFGKASGVEVDALIRRE